jgi:hypothetical protein
MIGILTDIFVGIRLEANALKLRMTNLEALLE